MTRTLRPGDFWRIDDRTGFKVPASETRKEWDGRIVHHTKFERRHPQELARPKTERFGVPDARPPVVTRIAGPLSTLITATAAAGAQTIEVELTARFLAGDRLQIGLDNNEMWRVVLLSVDDDSHLTLFNRLPYSVSANNIVINLTAVAVPDLG